MEHMKKLYFISEYHKEAFLELVEEMYLESKELKHPSNLLKRHLAFAYLIAAYQKEYQVHEGEQFYIEVGEELSLGGPTYLLDERYGERTKEYEWILVIALKILKGEISTFEEIGDSWQMSSSIGEQEELLINQIVKLLDEGLEEVHL